MVKITTNINVLNKPTNFNFLALQNSILHLLYTLWLRIKKHLYLRYAYVSEHISPFSRLKNFFAINTFFFYFFKRKTSTCGSIV